jgi:hypothetical protein
MPCFAALCCYLPQVLPSAVFKRFLLFFAFALTELRFPEPITFEGDL